MTDYLLLLGGLVLLFAGGELLVRGAATTAERLGMSPLLIGLTLVGFGTSAPELVTSVEASLAGSPGIAVGNVVGSNIANILLILGVAAMISPIAVRQEALRRDGMIVLATAVIFYGVVNLVSLDRVVGTVFLIMLASYIYYAYRQEMSGAALGHTAAFEKLEAHEELFRTQAAHSSPGGEAAGAAKAAANAGIAMPLLMAVGGLLVIVGGGKLLIDGATGIARSAGISETVIGLTIISVGTSLPELVTSVIAAIRRHADVALGNVLGSNIYNILGIAGVTGLLAPTTVPPEIASFDSVVLLVVSAALLVVARTGYSIGRQEGFLLLAGYVVYIATIWPS